MTSLHESTRSLLHALDPVQWARDALLFSPEPWQESVLRSLAPRVALNVCRQAGKSTCAAILALHTAIYKPNALVLVFAPSLRQSAEVFRKVEAFMAQLEARPDLSEQNASTITLATGSRIVCVPTSEQTLRGMSSPALIVLDEASRISDEAIAAIRPMLANGGGRMLMMSTPNGQRGAFHAAFTGQRSDWEHHAVPATQIPRISAAHLTSEKLALGPRVFAQEYCCEFTECDGALFDLDQINACLTDKVQPLFGPGGSIAARQFPGLLSAAVQPLGIA